MQGADEHNGAPLTWDPLVRGGEGGWVESLPATPPAVGPESDEDGESGRSGSHRQVIALCAAGVLVVAGLTLAVGVALRPDEPASAPESATAPATVATAAGNTTPGPTATANDAEQAAALDELLTSSATARQQVIDAVNDVDSCDSVSEARTTLDEAAGHRDDLLTRLDALSVDLIEGGPAAVTDLRTAWQHSAKADRAFASWAAAAQDCTPPGPAPRNGDYEQGVEYSGRATEAKKAFVGHWNPITTGYGLPSRSTSEI